MKRNSNVLFFLGIISIAAMLQLIGCGQIDDVKFLKDSTMERYKSATIGKAFDESFDSPKWVAMESKKGERIVEFTGTISTALHNSAVKFMDDLLNKGDALNKTKNRAQIIKHFAESVGKSDADAFFMPLKSKFGCDLVYYNVDGAILYGAQCDKEENASPMMDAVIKGILAETWKTGTPVQVQWTITADGKSFQIASMTSKAWEGLKLDAILLMIYH